MVNEKSQRYIVTLDPQLKRAVEMSAQSVGMKPAEYIRYCLRIQGDLLRENSTLRSKLREINKKEQEVTL